jgi:phosphoribosylaminoimidazole-succinocarboxamide synthase
VSSTHRSTPRPVRPARTGCCWWPQDRISAYDHILDSEIPDKGKVLTQLSLWWFDQLTDIIPNQVISSQVPEVPEAVAGRAVLVQRLDMVPIECIGRAYLTGSGLAEYRQTSSVCGFPCRRGCRTARCCPRRSSPRRPRHRSVSTTSR